MKQDNDSTSISLCNGCKCMTHSVRKGRCKYYCGKCGYDKSISDIYWNEAKSNDRKVKR